MNILTRSSSDKMFLGVCGGIGEYLGIDSRVLRILLVFGVFASFSGLFWIYLLLGIALPSEK
jgi:phage shock protein C